jgi:hypothetical protein
LLALILKMSFELSLLLDKRMDVFHAIVMQAACQSQLLVDISHFFIREPPLISLMFLHDLLELLHATLRSLDSMQCLAVP